MKLFVSRILLGIRLCPCRCSRRAEMTTYGRRDTMSTAAGHHRSGAGGPAEQLRPAATAPTCHGGRRTPLLLLPLKRADHTAIRGGVASQPRSKDICPTCHGPEQFRGLDRPAPTVTERVTKPIPRRTLVRRRKRCGV